MVFRYPRAFLIAYRSGKCLNRLPVTAARNGGRGSEALSSVINCPTFAQSALALTGYI
jgi:hypothetical protein